MNKNRERKIIELRRRNNPLIERLIANQINEENLKNIFGCGDINIDTKPIKVVKLKPQLKGYENPLESLSDNKEDGSSITLPESGLKIKLDDEKLKEVLKGNEEFDMGKIINEMILPFVDEEVQNVIKHFVLLPDGQVLNIKENEEETEMKKEEKREEIPLTAEGIFTASKLRQQENEEFKKLDEQAQESIEKDNEDFACKLGEWYETEDIEKCEDLPTLEESIKCRCEELKEEIENEQELEGSIMCYVGESIKYLVHECNCNMYEFRLFDRYLVTNIGINIVDTVIKAEMNYVNDTIVKFKLNDCEDIYACTVDELMELGLAIWVDSDTKTLNLSGIEYRGLTKICSDNEIEL